MRILAGIPFMSVDDIREGKALEVLEKFSFNPQSQFYDKNVSFKEKILKYFDNTWIQ